MPRRILAISSHRARPLAGVAALALAGALGACANPLTPYLSPPDPSASLVTSAIVQQRDGSCAGLEAAHATASADMKKSEDKIAKELEKPAPTVSSAFRRAFGPAGSGTTGYDEARRAEARAAALEEELLRRKCLEPGALAERREAARRTVVAPQQSALGGAVAVAPVATAAGPAVAAGPASGEGVSGAASRMMPIQ